MTEKAKPEDDLSIYMGTDLHHRRMEDATKRAVEKLVNVSRDDLFAGLSEAMGMLFGIGHFYRQLGLKHQAAKVFMAVFKWLKGGTD